MTLVGTALNLGQKMKIYPQVMTLSIKPQIWLFHVVVLLTTAKKWTKVKNARAGRARLLFLPTKYANLWRSRCRRRCRCLSSLMKAVHFPSDLTSLLRHRDPEKRQLIYLASRVAIHYVINEIYKNPLWIKCMFSKGGAKIGPGPGLGLLINHEKNW